MASYTPDQLAELVNLTLSKFVKDKWVDISVDLQDHYAMRRVKDHGGMIQQGGPDYRWKVQVNNSGSYRATGAFDLDQYNINDLTTAAVVPWRFQTANFVYDEIEEVFNSGEDVRIVDELKVRKHAVMNDIANGREAFFWTLPSASDVKSPYGLPYWLVRNATEGFNGGAPSGYTEVAGLNPTTYANWKNYTAAYTNISKDDCIRKMREALTYTNFRAPDPHPSPTEMTNKYSLATTYAVVRTCEEILESQNDNLGNDVASKDGKVLIRSIPLDTVFYLSARGEGADSTNPIYGINWSTFKVCGRKNGSKGAEVKWQKPIRVAGQHTVWAVHADMQEQYACMDRRRNFVMYQL